MGLRQQKLIPIYPFLVAALPAIHFYETNFRTLAATDGLRIILLYWALTALLMFLGRLIWKDLGRTAMVIGPLVAVLFLGNRLGPVLTLVLLGISVGLGVWLALRPRDVSRGVLPVNMALLVLAGMPIGQTVMASRALDSPVPTDLFHQEISLTVPDRENATPDIYYIVMDALGQPDYLEREFRLPPRLLRTILEQRGFRILHRGDANYQQTALSLTATTNLGYIHELLHIPDTDNGDRRVLAGMLADSRTSRALKNIGYDLVTYPSGYPLTRMNGAARTHRPFVAPTFLEYYVLEDGILPLLQPLVGRGPADISYAMRRQRLEYVFDHLGQARKGIPDDRPVFVFAHIMAPHPPFVFGRNGEALPSTHTFAYADGNHWYDIHGREGTPYYISYCEQVTYVMKRLGAAVDDILASSPEPPVIIIQGDHGPGSKLHLERPMYSDHAERFGIFNAWYVPPGVAMELEEGSTAVNTFPTLFNALFEAGLPLLPDRYFYARMSAPYAHLELEE